MHAVGKVLRMNFNGFSVCEIVFVFRSPRRSHLTQNTMLNVLTPNVMDSQFTPAIKLRKKSIHQLSSA